MVLREFLKPTKSKIILALALPFIYVLIVLIIGYIQDSAIIFPINYPITIVIGVLFESLITYPFTCAIVELANGYRSKELNKLKTDKKYLSLVLLSLILFNPVIIRLISVAVVFLTLPALSGFPCGVQIVEVFPDSPAEKAGLQDNDIILLFDDSPNARTINQLMQLLLKHEPGDIVSVFTNRGEYSMILGTNPDSGDPLIGASLANNICECGNGICEVGESVKTDRVNYIHCSMDCS